MEGWNQSLPIHHRTMSGRYSSAFMCHRREALARVQLKLTPIAARSDPGAGLSRCYHSSSSLGAESQ